MKIILLIGAGSFIGGIFRYFLSQFIQFKMLTAFPYGTLGVNIAGCFFIGLVLGFMETVNLPQEWRLFLATGLLGGFTTFSAFSGETVNMLRDGQIIYAAAYVVSSVLLGIFTTYIGFSIAKIA